MASAKTPKVNFIQQRMLFRAPAVASGSEREQSVDDFVSLSKSTIGEGAFSEVYKVRNKATEYILYRKIYAIKVIAKSLVVQKQLVQQLEREVRIMYELDHPYIIKIFTHFEDDRNVYVVMEYAAGGHMFKQLRRMREFDERTAAQYLRELVSALQYLHSRDPPIIHRDIKPENILLDSEGRSKLADFGWSNYYVDDATRDTYCGTLDYLAPEMVNRAGHTVKLDIWSLGILLFEMLSGRAPFEAKQKEALFDNIRKLKLKFPMTFPTLAKDLVRKLLRINPEERITLEELLAHQWMRTTQPLRPLVAVGAPEPQVLIETQASSRARPGSGYSSPKSNRAKLASPDSSPQFQERIRVVKALQDRIRGREEELKKVQEGNRHLQDAVADSSRQCEKIVSSEKSIREKHEAQVGRWHSIEEQLQRAKERNLIAKAEHAQRAVPLAHFRLLKAALQAQRTVLQHGAESFEKKTAGTQRQVALLHSVSSLRRSATLPKMSDMITAVCDFNRRLRVQTRAQSASKERVRTSPQAASPMMTPRRVKPATALPPSAGSTPRRIPRHRA